MLFILLGRSGTIFSRALATRAFRDATVDSTTQYLCKIRYFSVFLRQSVMRSLRCRLPALVSIRLSPPPGQWARNRTGRPFSRVLYNITIMKRQSTTADDIDGSGFDSPSRRFNRVIIFVVRSCPLAPRR